MCIRDREMGPFELWDAVGVEATVGRMKKEGRAVAELSLIHI